MIASTAESLGIEAAAPAQFVINLCASTSPMALSHPSSPELKKYTFFVSRQREEGRERFRLHMGYFDSQEQAEALLEAVRDVYPAAWAGPAPASGVGRRNRVAKPVAAAPAPVAAPAPAPAVPAAAPATAPAAAAAPPGVASPAPAAAIASPPPAAKPAPEAKSPAPALDAMSNVRDVLASLSEEAAPPASVPRLKPVAEPVPEPELTAAQALNVLESEASPAASLELEATHEPDPAHESEVRVMTPEDTQTLTDIRLDQQNNAPQCFAVQLIWSVSPIDVASLPHLAIFDAYTLYNVEGNRQGRKWFGLRLGFFSDPNSATQVANYVRSDYRAVAIVPVATKERDHARGGSTDRTAPAPRLGEKSAPLKPEAQLSLDKEDLGGFELLADDRPVPVKRDIEDATGSKPAAAAARQVPRLGPAKNATPPKAAPVARPPAAGKSDAVAAAPKASGRPTGKRVVVRKKPDAPLARTAPGAPTPLESTLEILGASTLTLDESREIINDSAVRRPVPKKPSGNRFSKLLSRLGGG